MLISNTINAQHKAVPVNHKPAEQNKPAVQVATHQSATPAPVTQLTLQKKPVTINNIIYPKTKKVEQTDNYFGVLVKDPYRWLEMDTAADVAQWVKEENEVTHSYLDKIPFRNKLKERITQIINYPKYSAPMRAGEFYFFSKNDGLQNQSVIYYQKGLDGEPKVFLDPNALSKDGTSAITILGFSQDKKHVAYATNESGSDWQSIKVMNVENAQHIDDDLKWVKFSSAAWYKDGFFYSRYDEPSKASVLSGRNEYHQIWYHQLGTLQSKDQLIYKDATHALRYFSAQTTEDEHFLIIGASEGTYGQELYFKDLTKPQSEIKLLFKGFDYEYGVVDNIGDQLLVTTNEGAANNYAVLVDPQNPAKANWKTIIPEQNYLLESVSLTGNRIFARYLKDVTSKVSQYDLNGKLEHEIKMPALGTVDGFAGNRDDKELFFTFTSFTIPPAIYRYDIASGVVKPFKTSEVKFNPEDYTTEQVFYKSKDGTSIPMFIVYKKGLKKDGNNPTLLYAYGGFNVNLSPAFSASRIVWLENGGVFALANLRGGGEYGDKWHKAGMLDKKQNVFDDFIAAGEYLISSKYTSSAKLAIQGGSNGGLLIGAVINQRPELFKVAIPQVGVMDMLRYHKFTVGWGWAVEYGSSDSAKSFQNLHKYSPLHNIKDVAYPATLVTTADHDDRVVPAHSFKYIATLQEHQKGNAPVLIRIDAKAGHGAGKPLSKTIDELTDIYSFLLYNLGVDFKK